MTTSAHLSVLVIDDQEINGERVRQIVNSNRFHRWLYGGTGSQVDVVCSRDGTSGLQNGLITAEYVDRFAAVVVDLRMPVATGARDWVDSMAKTRNYVELGYGGIPILTQLAAWGLLAKCVVHSANVESLFASNQKGVSDAREIFEEWVREGLTICPKGRPADVELEVQLFSLLHLSRADHRADPEARQGLLRVAHRGLRRGVIEHCLILGSSGTGKEYTARHLHALTGHYLALLREERWFRATEAPTLELEAIPNLDPSFSVLHGGSMSANLAISELFGHRKGAFTSAVADRWGLLAKHFVAGRRDDPLRTISKAIDRLTGDPLAQELTRAKEQLEQRLKKSPGQTDKIAVDDSTPFYDFFFDELGDLPPEAQRVLLRLIQFGEVRRLGDNDTHELRDQRGRVHVRIIAATSNPQVMEIANLSTEKEDKAAEAGSFRPDLVYRLGLPALYVSDLSSAEVPHLLRTVVSRRAGREVRFAPHAAAELIRLVERGYFVGQRRQFIQVAERAIDQAEERLAHRSILDAGTPMVLRSDLASVIGSLSVVEEASAEEQWLTVSESWWRVLDESAEERPLCGVVAMIYGGPKCSAAWGTSRPTISEKLRVRAEGFKHLGDLAVIAAAHRSDEYRRWADELLEYLIDRDDVRVSVARNADPGLFGSQPISDKRLDEVASKYQLILSEEARRCAREILARIRGSGRVPLPQGQRWQRLSGEGTKHSSAPSSESPT